MDIYWLIVKLTSDAVYADTYLSKMLNYFNHILNSICSHQESAVNKYGGFRVRPFCVYYDLTFKRCFYVNKGKVPYEASNS